MANTLIMFAMLIVGTTMMGYLALVGRLTSRAVFILMPAATLAICVLTLLVDAQDPLLPFVAMAMAAVAVVLVVTAGILLVLYFNRNVSARKEEDREDPLSSKVEV